MGKGTPSIQERRQQAKTWPTKTVTLSVSIYPRDDEMLQELKDHFGSNQSDVTRTAIRTLWVKVLGKNA